MNAIAIIISLIALVGAGFAFLRASSSHRIMTKRVEKQKDRITLLEERLRKLEGNAGRGRRNTDEPQEESRRNQPRQERNEQQEQRHEERQKQRGKKSRPERQPQDRSLQEEQPQERQQERQQERRPRERQSQERQPLSQERPAEERTGQERQSPQQEEGQQQRRQKRDNRRRNEPRDAGSFTGGEDEPINPATPITLEVAGGNLLDELELEAASAGNTPETAPASAAAEEPAPAHSGKAYAIIPEDGLIRQHQLQQQPDSDSYIEVDVPKDGGNMTYYRFNLAGNHAFVISQGIDRLENAFSFEKPSNRMVSQVVQQHDGVLARVGNGWKIEQKARIDFR